MKTIRKHRLVTLVFLGYFSLLLSQTSVNTAGGEATGNGGTASYTIGQVNYQTYTGDGGTLSEGIQHGYVISVATAPNKAPQIKLSINVYPNPTTDILTLTINEEKRSPHNYRLFDTQGKIIRTSAINSTQEKIDMKSLKPQLYFLTIYQNNTTIKTFTILKK